MKNGKIAEFPGVLRGFRARKCDLHISLLDLRASTRGALRNVVRPAARRRAESLGIHDVFRRHSFALQCLENAGGWGGAPGGPIYTHEFC